MTTVLLIKFDTNARLRRQAELEETGYRVVAAASLQEALDALVSADPDLAVLDPDLWHAQELNVLQALKSIDRAFPAIIYTDHSLFRDDFRYCMADAFLVRGSRRSSLAECISEVMEKRSETVG